MNMSLKDALSNIDLNELELDTTSGKNSQVLSAVREAINITKDQTVRIGHQSSHQTHSNHSTSPNRITRGEPHLKRP